MLPTGKESGWVSSHSLALLLQSLCLEDHPTYPPARAGIPAPTCPFPEVRQAERGPRLEYPKNGRTPSVEADCI